MFVTARNIQKSYDKLQVLKGINLEVQKGEVISIVGASGAGKSTLLHILGTLDRCDAGEVIINDHPVHTLSGKKLSDFRNKHIGFIFQFHQLLPEFTIVENVSLPAIIAGKSKSEAENEAASILAFLGLESRLNHKPSECSGGEQQRAAVARALINKPDLVLADEPSGNLDSVNARELHALFFRLRDEFNQTFIIVTHNEELADMADRKIVLKDGVVVL